MRQLTQNEIDNAPDWANSVFENGHGALCWFNNIDGYAIRIGNTGDPVQMSDVHYSFKTCKPINAIPSKEFEAIRKSFVTCNSDGEGHYNVTLEAKTLKEAQAIHREILNLRLR